MPVTLTSQNVLDDVIDWVVHPDYCQRVVTIANNTAIIPRGTSLVGRVAYSADGGTTWKMLVSGDNLAAANVVLAVLVPHLKLVADVAIAGNLVGIKVLFRGPARIHKNGLVLAAGVVEATVLSLLIKQGLQILTETGLEYNPAL